MEREQSQSCDHHNFLHRKVDDQWRENLLGSDYGGNNLFGGETNTSNGKYRFVAESQASIVSIFTTGHGYISPRGQDLRGLG